MTLNSLINASTGDTGINVSTLQAGFTGQIIEELLQYHQHRRDIFHQRFTDVLKCLGIIIDENLIKITLLQNSFIRKLSNYFVHRSQSNGVILAESISQLDELAGDFPGVDDNKFLLPKINFSEESTKLATLLEKSESYFEQEHSFMEDNVDKFIKYLGDVSRDSRKHERLQNLKASDLHILVAWLESFNPVGA